VTVTELAANPLHPYDWEVCYADGRRIRRTSPGGPWHERDVPTAGLTAVRVWGHPASPLTVQSGGGVVGVVLRMRGTVAIGPTGTSHVRRWLFGLRLPESGVVGYRLDEAGAVTRYVGPIEAW
jgi:hypothetical protein